jgi:hypothetical protein
MHGFHTRGTGVESEVIFVTSVIFSGLDQTNVGRERRKPDARRRTLPYFPRMARR